MRIQLPRLFPLSLSALVLAAAPASAQDSPFQARSCPVPAGMQGYPVWAASADGTALDSAYTRALANAAARRWEPPSGARGRHDNLGRLRGRIQPPEPRFPDDWAPSAGHVARVAVTLRRGARPGEAEVTVAARARDRDFDRSLTGLFREGAPGAPELPPLPNGVDSVRVNVGFGGTPPEGAGVVRFAVQQTRVEVVPGTLQVARPTATGTSIAPPSATVKYDLDASGRIDPASIDVLAASDRSMERNVRAGLLRARFVPAQSNCRAVALSVVQQFGGR